MSSNVKGSIFLSIKDLQGLLGCSYETARKEYKLLQIRMELQRKLTVREYCELEGIHLLDVVDALNLLR